MWYVTLLGFVFGVLVLASLAAPLYLIVEFPDSAKYFTEIAKTLIPWVSVIVLLLVFHEGVKQVFGSLAGALWRLRKIGAPGFTSEFEEQQRNVYPLTKEQIQQLADYIQSVKTAKEGETAWAWHFFVKYVAATIYGSQVKLLRSLRDESPKGPEELLSFYKLFLQREPEATHYKFEQYVQYLVSNVLIQFDASNSKYVITANGKRFLKALEDAGVSWSTLRG